MHPGIRRLNVPYYCIYATDERLIEEIRRPNGRLSSNVQSNINKAVDRLHSDSVLLRDTGKPSYDALFEQVHGGSFAAVIVVRLVLGTVSNLLFIDVLLRSFV